MSATTSCSPLMLGHCARCQRSQIDREHTLLKRCWIADSSVTLRDDDVELPVADGALVETVALAPLDTEAAAARCFAQAASAGRRAKERIAACERRVSDTRRRSEGTYAAHREGDE